MNLKFNLRDDLIARFAWGKVMSQPSFDHLNPGGQKHAGQKLVTEGDPTLLPYIAEQVDIGIEWYPSEDAFFSVHAFAMEVESFIIEKSRYEDWIEPNGSTLFDPESGGNLRLLYSGPVNGDGATIAGMEFSANYSFTSLPEPLDGFGVQLNHTWITTDGEFANPSSGAKFGVPGLSEGTTNLVAFYEKGRISGRIAWNKRSEFLVGVESTVGQSPEFTMPYWQIDAGFSFDITDNLKFVFEGINLTDNNVDLFVRVGPTSRMPQLFLASNSGRRWQTGIRYRL